MHAVLEQLAPELPRERPRYLMGVGFPDDLLEGIARGVDLFDCVAATRNGRHGSAWTADRPGQRAGRGAAARRGAARRGLRLRVLHAGFRGRTCGTCSWPRSIWDRDWCRFTTSGS